MTKIKKIFTMLLVCVMIISTICVPTMASETVNVDEIPADLPIGTIKIAEGIYAYTPDENDIEPMNSQYWTNIGDVPAMGTIVQPSALSNIIVDSGHNYLKLKITKAVMINLVSGNQSVFGADYEQWPRIGGGTGTTYYIEADYYNIRRNVAYRMQLTSQTISPKYDVEVWYATGVDNSDLI